MRHLLLFLASVPTVLVLLSACLDSGVAQPSLDPVAAESNTLAGNVASTIGEGDTNQLSPAVDANLVASQTITLEGKAVRLPFATWQTVAHSSVLYFNISDDPNRCSYLRAQPPGAPETSNVIAFYVTSIQNSLLDPPAGSGVYDYLDSGALRPAKGMFWSTLSWRKPGDDLASLPASRYATGGTITIVGLRADQKTGGLGAIDVRLDAKSEPITLSFSAEYCDAPRAADDHR